jgi:hypothetical protein
MVGVASQLSVAVANPVLPGSVEEEHSIETFGGQVMAGGVLSTIVICCKQVLEFPQSSVADHVLVMVRS